MLQSSARINTAVHFLYRLGPSLVAYDSLSPSTSFPLLQTRIQRMAEKRSDVPRAGHTSLLTPRTGIIRGCGKHVARADCYGERKERLALNCASRSLAGAAAVGCCDNSPQVSLVSLVAFRGDAPSLVDARIKPPARVDRAAVVYAPRPRQRPAPSRLRGR